MTFVEEREERGIRRREFDLDRGGRLVSGVIWSPPGVQDGAPLVCYGHGASGDRHQQPTPWLATNLANNHGICGLSIDGPVHGRRRVGDGGRGAFWPEWEREGSVDDMVADWTIALDFAQTELGVGPVGYWGLSMGTIYGAPFVAAESRISAAVLGLMGITGPDHYRPRIQAAAEAISCPVLFLVQLEDELFSREDCCALFDALGTTDKRMHANPGLHPDIPVEELHHSMRFLAERLTNA